MMLRNRLCLAQTAFLMISSLRAQDVPVDTRPAVIATSGKPRISSSYYDKHKGHRYERQTTTMDGGKIGYALHYRACVDECHGDRVGIVEGYIGLSAPCNANWYGGGFLKLKLNGEDVGSWRLADRRVTDQGERGACQYVWETPVATVRFRFILLPGARYLCAELAWTPKQPIERAEVNLLCFPSFFTTARNRTGERHVISNVKDVPQGKQFSIDPSRESYLFYCDSIFDVARGEGAGPCALWFDPEVVSGGRASVGSYGVGTLLKLRPEKNAVRLAFWEFPGASNDEALSALKDDVARISEDLPRLDTTPLALARLDASKKAGEMTAMLSELGSADSHLKDRIRGLLDVLSKRQVATGAPAEWQAEVAVLDALPKLEEALWQLRIQALLEEADAIRKNMR